MGHELRNVKVAGIKLRGFVISKQHAEFPVQEPSWFLSQGAYHHLLNLIMIGNTKPRKIAKAARQGQPIAMEALLLKEARLEIMAKLQILQFAGQSDPIQALIEITAKSQRLQAARKSHPI